MVMVNNFGNIVIYGNCLNCIGLKLLFTFCLFSLPLVVFNALYSTQDNVLVTAPTGSGKTICAEFAILKLFSDVPKAAKAVYVTPYASLAKQVSNRLIVAIAV